MKIEHIIILILAAMLLFGLLSLKVLSKEKWESSHRGQRWFQGIFLSLGAACVLILAFGLLAFYNSAQSNTRISDCRFKSLPVLVGDNYTQKEISDILEITCR